MIINRQNAQNQWYLLQISRKIKLLIYTFILLYNGREINNRSQTIENVRTGVIENYSYLSAAIGSNREARHAG